jgi:hypothetical protein
MPSPRSIVFLQFTIELKSIFEIQSTKPPRHCNEEDMENSSHGVHAAAPLGYSPKPK